MTRQIDSTPPWSLATAAGETGPIACIDFSARALNTDGARQPHFDPANRHLQLPVNGIIKQDDTSGDMIFSLAEQIATASRIMTFDPGDAILTGTLAGVGVPRKEFLKVGDVVDAEIEGIGTLSVAIQPESTD